MSKHEAPPFRMVIERGKLVPATAYDAERLDTYRSGSTVRVRFVEDKDRVLVRKWWAVLGLVVKQCAVPWKTKDEASEAIKLALGIVNLTKTVGGAWMQYPKSLTDLTDPELEDAVDQMLALVQRMTGIDPDTLRKEIADVGQDDEPEPSTAAPLVDEGSGGESPTPDPAAAPPSNEPAKADAPADEGMPIADAAWLLSAARQLWAATGKGEQVLVTSIAADLKKNTPATIGKAARDRAAAVVRRCKTVCFGEIEPAEALEIVAGIVGVEPKEIAAQAERG